MPSKIHRRSGNALVGLLSKYEYQPDVVFQVGVGNHCQEIDVMREEWNGVQFYGCEPHPTIVENLERNKTYPGRIIPTAIGDKFGAVTLYSKHRHKDGSSLHPHNVSRRDEKYKEISVPITTLDSLLVSDFRDIKNVLLWLDCEGSELAALNGANEFIKRVDVVNVEMTGKPPGAGWCSPVDVHDELIKYGFLRTWIHTIRSSSGQYDAVYVRAEMLKPEFCVCPYSIAEFQKRKVDD